MEDAISSLPSYRRITTLSGPISYYYYNQVMGKRILLLGDIHLALKNCSNYKAYKEKYITVYQWLEDLFTHTDTCIDFMLETELGWEHLKDVYEPVKPIDIMRQKFDDFKNDKVRNHAIDIRQFFQNYLFFLPEAKVFNKKQSKYLMGKSSTKNDLIVKTIKAIINEKYVNSYFKPILNDLTVIEIQMLIQHSDYTDQKYKIDRIKPDDHNNLYELIYFSLEHKILSVDSTSFTEQYYIDLQTLIYSFLERARNIILKEIHKSIFKDKADRFIDLILQSSSNTYFEFSYLLDTYLLARLFITFNQRKRGPALCHDSNTMKNVIIYAGNAHILSIKNFLDANFNVLPLHAYDNRGIQCINFNGSFDFFTGLYDKKILKFFEKLQFTELDKKTFYIMQDPNYYLELLDTFERISNISDLSDKHGIPFNQAKEYILKYDLNSEIFKSNEYDGIRVINYIELLKKIIEVESDDSKEIKISIIRPDKSWDDQD